MLESETTITLGRLALVGFVSIAPTLLFLGLCRGLEWLRDDAFVLEWTESNDGAFDPADMNDVFGVLTGEIGGESTDTSEHCRACGVGMPSNGRFCSACLGTLPRDRSP